MSTSAEPRWLSPDATADYISSRVDKLPRLVKAGKLPSPSHHLGPHQPRFDRLAIDRMFEGGSGGHEESIDAAIERVFRNKHAPPSLHQGPRGRPGKNV